MKLDKNIEYVIEKDDNKYILKSKVISFNSFFNVHEECYNFVASGTLEEVNKIKLTLENMSL